MCGLFQGPVGIIGLLGAGLQQMPAKAPAVLSRWFSFVPFDQRLGGEYVSHVKEEGKRGRTNGMHNS